MSLATIRPARGKLIHAASSEPIPLTSTTYSAMAYCGKEYKGTVDFDSVADDLTCPKCDKAFRAIIADELSALSQEFEMHGEPTVHDLSAHAPILASPEVTREPRQNSYSEGRRRHGAIRQARAERRRMMKELVKR